MLIVKKKQNKKKYTHPHYKIWIHNSLIYIVKKPARTNAQQPFPKLSNSHHNIQFQVLIGQDS